MSSMVVHFRDGSKEFRYPVQELKEGDIVWHDGRRFRVLAIVQDDGRPQSVTIEPDSDGLGGLGDLPRSEESALRLVPAE